MRRRRWMALLLVLSLLGAGFWFAQRVMSSTDTDEGERLYDRLWMTAAPDVETDFMHDLYIIKSVPYGFFARASYFRFEEELFEYELEGRLLKLRFPQTERTARMSFKVSLCDELPPFELCLDLDENPWGGPRRYYAFLEEDEDEDQSQAPRIVRAQKRAADLVKRNQH